MNAESTRIFFNSMAKDWDNTVCHNPEKIRRLLALLQLQQRKGILDVGTGTGVLLPYLLELAAGEALITAIDLSEEMIKQARKKYGQYPVVFVSGDVTLYPFPEESFDAIVCYSVFPHFAQPALVLKKLASLLRPGGRLLIGHSESRETINARHRKLGNSLISHGLPAAQELVRLLGAAGLRPVDQLDSDELYYVLAAKEAAPSAV